MSIATVGFLGLGTMGRVMAGRLVDAGHQVVVWNRSRGPVDELVARGAIAADSPAQALAAPLSFSMLADDGSAFEVLSEANLTGDAGRLHVSMASLSPSAADRLVATFAQVGVDYLAAPVLGRAPVAAEGKLNIVVGGAAADIERARPYFEVLGQRIWPVGDVPRTANVVKVAVNYNLLHAFQAIGESLALVEANGVDAKEFTELLSSTLFGGVAYTNYGAMIAERRYTPAGFSMKLGSKDLGLAESLAAEAGIALPTAAVLRPEFDAALASEELRDLDWSAVAEIVRAARPAD